MGGVLGIHSLNPADKPRERLTNFGAQALSDVELLAVVLRSGGRHSSALSLASLLLAHFGSFKKLLNANIEEVLAFRDVGVAKASCLKAMGEIFLRVRDFDFGEKVRVAKPEDVFNVIRKDMYAKKQECLFAIFLDAKNVVIAKKLIFIGTVNETLVHPREIFREAVLKNAVSIILAHNHPSGDPTPSNQDTNLTKRVAEAGAILGIPLIDHVVVCDSTFVSIKTGNYLNRKEVIK